MAAQFLLKSPTVRRRVSRETVRVLPDAGSRGPMEVPPDRAGRRRRAQGPRRGAAASHRGRLQLHGHAAIGRVGGINFKIEKSASGEWVAESTNVDGIITGGKNYPHDVNANIKDAIFTYFEIPPELCNDSVLR